MAEFCRSVAKAIEEFFYPRRCIYCTELGEQGGLFCAPCQTIIEFLPSSGRCRICYRKKREGICRKCRRVRPPFQKNITLFSSLSPIQALFEREEVHAKTIGALFFLRFIEAKWSLPEQVTSDKSLEQSQRQFSKWLAMIEREGSVREKRSGSSDYTLHLSGSLRGLFKRKEAINAEKRLLSLSLFER